jgi:sugar phosphate permease
VLPKPRDVLKLFKIRDYNLIVLGYIAYTFAMGAYAFWGPTFLVRFHGLSNQFANTFFGGTLVVAGLFGTLVGGFLATKWHRKFKSAYAWLCGVSVLISAPLTTLAFMSSDKTVVMVSLALAMFCIFLSTGPINTLILEASPLNLQSTGMALSIFCIHLFGDVWSPQIVGYLSDRWESLSGALMILPGAFLVAAVFWIKLALEQHKRLVPSRSN